MYNTFTYNQNLYNAVLEVLIASGVTVFNDTTDPIFLTNEQDNNEVIYL